MYFSSKKTAFVQNEEKIVQNEERNVEKSLRPPQTFFHFVQNELKIVHFEITLVSCKPPILGITLTHLNHEKTTSPFSIPYS